MGRKISLFTFPFLLLLGSGFAPAQNALGAQIIRKNEAEGGGAKGENLTMAFQYFEAAAKGGAADGHFNLGVFYRDGVGTRKDVKVNNNNMSRGGFGARVIDFGWRSIIIYL